MIEKYNFKIKNIFKFKSKSKIDQIRIEAIKYVIGLFNGIKKFKITNRLLKNMNPVKGYIIFFVKIVDLLLLFRLKANFKIIKKDLPINKKNK